MYLKNLIMHTTHSIPCMPQHMHTDKHLSRELYQHNNHLWEAYKAFFFYVHKHPGKGEHEGKYGYIPDTEGFEPSTNGFENQNSTIELRIPTHFHRLPHSRSWTNVLTLLLKIYIQQLPEGNYIYIYHIYIYLLRELNPPFNRERIMS